MPVCADNPPSGRMHLGQNEEFHSLARTCSSPSLISSSTSPSTSTLRPVMKIRSDTDALLSYYQSDLADGTLDYTHLNQTHTSDPSSGSSSSSDYSESSASSPIQQVSPDAICSPARRRSKTPSEGGSDRRRIAIVQLDDLSSRQSTDTSFNAASTHSSSLRSRRGLSELQGLALVAPPDASPNAYKYIEPPSTAPVGIRDKQFYESTMLHHHHRAASEAMQGKQSHHTPEVVLVVNDVPRWSETEHQPHMKNAQSPLADMNPSTLSIPSPETVPRTPEIGQSKAVDRPVAPPVVVNLAPSVSRARDHHTPQFSPDIPGSYANYQPGVHATAGPLPPPPRVSFTFDSASSPPPRPPRLHTPQGLSRRSELDAVKQVLQLPSSVSEKLEVRRTSTPGSSASEPSASSSQYCTPASTPSLPSSSAFTESPSTSVMYVNSFPGTCGNCSHSNSSTMAVQGSHLQSVKSIHRREAAGRGDSLTDESLASSELSEIPEIPLPVEKSLRHAVEGLPDQVTSVEHSGNLVSPPPKSSSPLKRLSRRSRHGSTSQTSRARSPSASTSRTRSSFTHTPPVSNLGHGQTPESLAPPSSSSPTATLVRVVRPRKMIRAITPACMQCPEIHSAKTSLERCLIYASKINELYHYDSGLGDWIVASDMQTRGERLYVLARPRMSNASTAPKTRRLSNTSATPSSPLNGFKPRRRHVSRSSVMSDATFPMRFDSGTATDLMAPSSSDAAPSSPPPLPYPSLATTTVLRPSSTVHSIPSSPLRSLVTVPGSKGGFFSSLGRKSSLKKSHTLSPASISPPSQARQLVKSPSVHHASELHRTSAPQPVTPVTQTIPGGPRALQSRRMQKSRTIIVPASATFAARANSTGIARHPSLTPRPSNVVRSPVVTSSAEFERQVDELVTVLPNADRSVLAGYLRRTGQGYLAVGQYIEDQQNGHIRRD
ncbi:hypothetical protein FISHEDRAFT_76114 [Fistulina hepatica ATCC 64428]|uniref:Uncharacterized protein n=1 Tax=Fistulina hepatica ATCC 64428 TaxID=1128425 RepID=A0A0D7A7J6_9AGAR|nr:hypothetical protein FISHEDRAFT_76114 [Fistulina hepatica ATCC 64428]